MTSHNTTTSTHSSDEIEGPVMETIQDENLGEKLTLDEPNEVIIFGKPIGSQDRRFLQNMQLVSAYIEKEEIAFIDPKEIQSFDS